MLETMRPTSKIHLQTDDRLSPLIPIEPAHDSDAIIAHYAKTFDRDSLLDIVLNNLSSLRASICTKYRELNDPSKLPSFIIDDLSDAFEEITVDKESIEKTFDKQETQ